jgi:hypothetical protein
MYALGEAMPGSAAGSEGVQSPAWTRPMSSTRTENWNKSRYPIQRRSTASAIAA